MILSVSRRTDIPAFYSDWFFRRLGDGRIVYRNPMNHRQLSRIRLSPETVDCIVFWTKNPAPMLERLDELEPYRYYFTVTVTPYRKDIERNLPEPEQRLENFLRLSERIGPQRTVWRYDPIALSPEMSAEWHAEHFGRMADRLTGATQRCVISFLDEYRSNREALTERSLRAPERGEIRYLAAEFSRACGSAGIKLQTCCEQEDLSEFGISRGSCIDPVLVAEIIGSGLDIPPDKNQREHCGCAQATDIGDYNTCPGGCVYCYASHSARTIARNFTEHDPEREMLTGELPPDGEIPERLIESNITGQMSLGG